MKGHAVLKTDDGGRSWVQGHLLEGGPGARLLAGRGSRLCGRAPGRRTSGTRGPARVSGPRRPTRCASAEPSAALLRHLATFQMVEGRVARVGNDARQHLSQLRHRTPARVQRVAEARRSRPAWRRSQQTRRVSSRPLVRVRGWIAERGGEPSSISPRQASVEVIAASNAAARAGRPEAAAPKMKPPGQLGWAGHVWIRRRRGEGLTLLRSLDLGPPRRPRDGPWRSWTAPR